MFTQRNNKAKCFQDCIVEKKQNRKMNGLRFRWDSGWVTGGWSCHGVGMGGWVRGVGGWLGGPWSENLKPFTLSCTPCSQTECKMSGQCGDRRLCSRIWFRVDRWIQRHTARGALTHPRTELQIHLTIFLVTSCDINCRAINGWPRMKL